MAGSAEILTALRELANAKQIERTELQELLKDGILAALAKKHGPSVQAEVEIDDGKGAIRIVILKKVVEDVQDPVGEITLEEARYEDPDYQVGDIMEIPVEFAEFGRSAVQAAKQRIVQRVREGERSKIRDEFASRVGDLLSGEIQQIERGKIVLMLNKFREAEAIIPYREQNHRETYTQGEPIRAVLKKIEETPKGPRLILSRADAMFVQALFRLEVPEIQSGIVEIRASSREVGSRTKIAVVSKDDGIDPVGACVGLKGSRVQAVVQELGGERIDIVPWSADPERFAKLALAPAKVARVFSEASTKTIQAVVDEDQLSLAIGRNGQNVRLASEPLLEPRVAREGRRHPALRSAPGRRGGRRAALRHRRARHGDGRCARGRRLSHAERHHRPRARGFPQAPRHRARRGRPHHADHQRAHRGRRGCRRR
jgi:N utilization substance protein A